jgi:hypothetical protein
MPSVDRKAPDKKHVQSVIFKKSADWTKKTSKKWLEEHDYYTDGLDDTENSFRYRQYDPDDSKFIYRQKEIEKDSISLVYAIPKGEAKANQFVTFRASTNPVQKVHHAGKDYLVAPAVAIREGVFNGALVLADEIGAFAEAWNGIPVPLGHPQDSQGNYLSANTPDIVAACPARFFNAHMVGDKLAGEIWFDVELAKALGGDALEALRKLEAGEPIEISTGYFPEIEEVAGKFNGQPYTGIQRNLRPDHLALLLHERAACNWQMGCGVPRVNKTVKELEINHMTDKLVVIHNDLSLDEQLSRVYTEFSEQFCSSAPMPGHEQPWIREVFPDKVIVKYEGKLFAYPYTIDAESQVKFGEPAEVEMVYQPVTGNTAEPPATNAATTTTEPPLTNEQKGLLAALRNFFGIHKPEPGTPCPMQANCQLNSANTETPMTQPNNQASTTQPGNIQTPATQPLNNQASAAQPVILSEDEKALQALVKDAGGVEAVKTGLMALKAAETAERTGLVTAITANTKAFTADDLAAMSIDQLKKLRDATSPADFSGRGTPRDNSHSADLLVEAPMPG